MAEKITKDPEKEFEPYKANICICVAVLRKKPSDRSPVAGLANYGELVTVTEEKEEWVKLDNGLWLKSVNIKRKEA